jgi:SAM-dependent methyltransferase
MDSSYLSQLEKIKGTFEGSEQSLVVDLVASSFEKRSLSILDVGSGSGESILKKAADLDAVGYSIELTMLDLFPPSLPRDCRYPVTVEIMPFEEYCAAERFDVVNSTQSIYYFEDLAGTLEKMFRLVAENGLLMLTLWSESCILHKIYRAVFNQDKIEVVTAESIIPYLQSIAGPENVGVSYFDGKVDIGSWLESEDLLIAAATVVSRRGSAEHLLPNEISDFRSYLESLNDSEVRRNAVIMAKVYRPYEAMVGC